MQEVGPARLLFMVVAVSFLASFTVGNSGDRAVSGAIVDSQGDIAADAAQRAVQPDAHREAGPWSSSTAFSS